MNKINVVVLAILNIFLPLILSGSGFAKGTTDSPVTVEGTVSVTGVVRTEKQAYKPFVRARGGTDTTDDPEPVISSFTPSPNQELTSIDLIVNVGSADLCGVIIRRTGSDIPSGSNSEVFNHSAFRPETIHFTFDPPIILEEEVEVLVGALGSPGQVCAATVTFRFRPLPTGQ